MDLAAANETHCLLINYHRYRGFRVRRVAGKFDALASQTREVVAAATHIRNLALAVQAAHTFRERRSAWVVQRVARTLLAQTRMRHLREKYAVVFYVQRLRRGLSSVLFLRARSPRFLAGFDYVHLPCWVG